MILIYIMQKIAHQYPMPRKWLKKFTNVQLPKLQLISPVSTLKQLLAVHKYRDVTSNLPFCDSLTLWSSVCAMSLGSAGLTGFLPTGGGITGFFAGTEGALRCCSAAGENIYCQYVPHQNNTFIIARIQFVEWFVLFSFCKQDCQARIRSKNTHIFFATNTAGSSI